MTCVQIMCSIVACCLGDIGINTLMMNTLQFICENDNNISIDKLYMTIHNPQTVINAYHVRSTATNNKLATMNDLLVIGQNRLTNISGY